LELHQIHLIPAWVQTRSSKVRTDQLDRAELLDLLTGIQPEAPGAPPS
jgi:hypothetical protein